MEREKKRSVERAAISVTRGANTQVTEVIERGPPLTVDDRIAAAVAAFVLCGATYFVVWFLMSLFLDNGTGALVGLIPWSRWLPVDLTALTTMAAWIAPGWTYRVFGKAMRPLEPLFRDPDSFH